MMRRGQAYTETVVFLPVFLIILFGIIWIVQSTVANERLQLAVRYSGLISNQTSPYSAWSLYALYDSAEYPGSMPQTRTCSTPAPGALSNSAPFPGPTSAPFWQPSSITSSTCTQSTVTMQNGLTQAAIFNDASSSMTATTNVPAYLTHGRGALPGQQQLSAQERFFGAPDIATMLSCYGALDQEARESLSGSGGNAGSAPGALPLVPTAGSLTPNC